MIKITVYFIIASSLLLLNQAQEKRNNEDVVKYYHDLEMCRDLLSANKLEEALVEAVELLHFSGQQFGESSIYSIKAMAFVAKILFYQGEKIKSREILIEALDIIIANPNRNNRLISSLTLQIANTYERNEFGKYVNYNEVEKLYLKAVKFSEKGENPNPNFIASSLFDLYKFYHEQGKFDKSKDTLDRLTDLISSSNVSPIYLEQAKEIGGVVGGVSP